MIRILISARVRAFSASVCAKTRQNSLIRALSTLCRPRRAYLCCELFSGMHASLPLLSALGVP